MFLDAHAAEFFRDWNRVVNDTVALLHAEAGRHPNDRRLSDLIGELSTRSDEFRGRWAAHDVQIHTTGVKLIHHPVVGDLDLSFESFPLAADPSQSLLVYTAEPGSPSQDALRLLPAGPRPPTPSSPLPRLTPRSRLNRSGRLTDIGDRTRSGAASVFWVGDKKPAPLAGPRNSRASRSTATQRSVTACADCRIKGRLSSSGAYFTPMSRLLDRLL